LHNKRENRILPSQKGILIIPFVKVEGEYTIKRDLSKETLLLEKRDIHIIYTHGKRCTHIYVCDTHIYEEMGIYLKRNMYVDEKVHVCR